MNEVIKGVLGECYSPNVTDKSFLSGSPFDRCLSLFSFSHHEKRVKQTSC